MRVVLRVCFHLGRERLADLGEEEKRKRRFRGVLISYFSFLFKGVPRENILKEGRKGLKRKEIIN